MGFHILITDQDRMRYLNNVYQCLAPGGPMLLYRQAYRADAYEGPIDNYEQWTALMGIDYETAEKRQARSGDSFVDVMIPRIAGRGRSETGYRKELTDAGFIVDVFEAGTPEEPYRASIWAHKP